MAKVDGGRTVTSGLSSQPLRDITEEADRPWPQACSTMRLPPKRTPNRLSQSSNRKRAHPKFGSRIRHTK